MNPCLVLSIYNHGGTISAVIEGLEPLGLPCLIIDDGSDAETREVLVKLAARFPWVSVERLPSNSGRGAALKLGFRMAAERGFTHALQIDADGQHDPYEAPALLEAARRRPGALVLGVPIFGPDIPRSRLYGHWVSRFWVWIETWSFAIRDSLCGFRCFPLDPTVRLLARVECGDRMDFDTEIAVRLYWDGISVESVPVHTRYFSDGISHFDLFWDNVRISWLHTRLFFGMLLRAPLLLARIRKDHR